MTVPESPSRQPIFNLPPAVTLLIAALVIIHLVRVSLLSEQADDYLLVAFSFIPARVMDPAAFGLFPGGEGASVWSFLTYAFLHANWGHVAINCLWLAAFGSPLAWRFGTTRFLLFSAAGATGGAVLHLLTSMGEMAPMVGASAAISAHMAGASRFVFTTGVPIGGFSRARPEAYRRPAAPLAEIIRDRRVVVFLLAWFGVNLVFGIAGSNGGLTSGAIAWQAHIGGFIVGLVLFPLFDPVGTDPVAGTLPPIDRDRA